MRIYTFLLPEDVMVKQLYELHDGRWFASVTRRQWPVDRMSPGYHTGFGAHGTDPEQAISLALEQLPLADAQVADRLRAHNERLEEQALARQPKAKPTQAELEDFLADLGI